MVINTCPFAVIFPYVRRIIQTWSMSDECELELVGHAVRDLILEYVVLVKLSVRYEIHLFSLFSSDLQFRFLLPYSHILKSIKAESIHVLAVLPYLLVLPCRFLRCVKGDPSNDSEQPLRSNRGLVTSVVLV